MKTYETWHLQNLSPRYVSKKLYYVQHHICHDFDISVFMTPEYSIQTFVHPNIDHQYTGHIHELFCVQF